MKGFLKWSVATALVLAALGCEKRAGAPAVVREQPALADYGAVTDFALTERDGSSVGRETLAGRVWLVNFIFTRCMGPCPLMSGHMKTLAQHFAGDARVRFASISTDPAYDTPAVLREYAARFGADQGPTAARWLFLTGDKAEIVRLARDVLKLSAGEDPGMHSARFVLVDAGGRIRGWYDSQAPEFQESIRRDAAALAAAAPAAH